MSVTKRIKQGFLRLPLVKKAILLSSGLLMLSAVLPWYDNRNSFGIGETYLGIQGPLFLVGMLIFGFGAVSFFNLFLPLFGKNFFKLRRKSGMVSLLLGMQSLFLLVIANSVFYHPSFGTNVSHKGTRFGMLIAFVSIAVMVIAGWMTHRKEKKGEFEEIEDIMTNVEPVVASPVSSVSTPSPSSSARPSYQSPVPRPSAPSTSSTPSTTRQPYSGDPLTLDAKTRYKMMRSQARYSQAAQNNLWGSGGGSAFGNNSDS